MRSPLNRTIERCLLLAGLFCCAARAADFGFSVIIRAGQNGNNDWELGIGPVGNNAQATAQVAPFYPNGGQRGFEIGYNQATNLAYVRVYENNGVNYDQAAFQPAGGGPLSASGRWTLPGGSFYVAAASIPIASSVSVSNMAFASGLSILQGLSTTSLTAAQPGNSTALATLASPVVFQAQGAGGSWLLSGRITFTGLGSGNRANGSELQFDLTANASEAPEPSTALCFAIGLGLCVFRVHRRQAAKS